MMIGTEMARRPPSRIGLRKDIRMTNQCPRSLKASFSHGSSVQFANLSFVIGNWSFFGHWTFLNSPSFGAERPSIRSATHESVDRCWPARSDIDSFRSHLADGPERLPFREGNSFES